MADNYQANTPTTPGKTFRSYDIGAIQHPGFIPETTDGARVSATNPLPAERPLRTTLLSRFLDLNGDGTGSKQVTLDHSGAPVQYYLEPSGSQKFYVQRLIVSVYDTVGMALEKYGNLTVLTNGLLLEKRAGATIVEHDLLDGVPVKDNLSWSAVAHEAALLQWGTTNECLRVVLNFDDMGADLELLASNSERLTLVAEDDFTGLLGHTFMAQGYVVE